MIAGSHTADTTFIVFGHLAQRLIGRSVDALVMENPTGKDHIPREITDLLEKEFVWNVSFIENTISSGIVAFQVNRIIKGGQNYSLDLLQSPSGSQASSVVPSMALSPAASQDVSVGQHTETETPSVGFTDAQLALVSPSTGTQEDKNIDDEFASKTPGEDVAADNEDYDQVSASYT